MDALFTRMIGTTFMLFHPIWTISTSGGDCGELQVDCSWIVLGLEIVLISLQMIRLIWRRNDPEQMKDFDDRFQPSPADALD